MFTIAETVTILQKFHTHEEIIHRKKRVVKKRQDDDKEYADVDYLLVADKKDNSEAEIEGEDEDPIFCVSYDN